VPFQENKPENRTVYELFVNFRAYTAKNITVRICTVIIWAAFLCRFKKKYLYGQIFVKYLAAFVNDSFFQDEKIPPSIKKAGDAF